jgi:hypothetical protein
LDRARAACGDLRRPLRELHLRLRNGDGNGGDAPGAIPRPDLRRPPLALFGARAPGRPDPPPPSAVGGVATLFRRGTDERDGIRTPRPSRRRSLVARRADRGAAAETRNRYPGRTGGSLCGGRGLSIRSFQLARSARRSRSPRAFQERKGRC